MLNIEVYLTCVHQFI